MSDRSPDPTWDTWQQAQLFFDAGQPTEAARLLDDVLAADPRSSAALELHARALYASAQLGRAETALRALLERHPDDGWAHLALARTLERQGRAAEAAACRRLAGALGRTD